MPLRHEPQVVAVWCIVMAILIIGLAVAFVTATA